MHKDPSIFVNVYLLAPSCSTEVHHMTVSTFKEV